MSIKGISIDPYRVQFERTTAPARAAESGTRTGQNAPAGDKVSVSQDALLRTEALRTALAAPDIRQEKVDALREKVASGDYRIDSRKVADKLLRSELGFTGPMRKSS